jgi:hypothetical protein
MEPMNLTLIIFTLKDVRKECNNVSRPNLSLLIN